MQNEADESMITLDSAMARGGSNLSVGQRQIIALARAMVRESKLLILDEGRYSTFFWGMEWSRLRLTGGVFSATSAIDYKTDAVIQESLRNELKKDVTIITVAHRLQTIMDADKIVRLYSIPPSPSLSPSPGLLFTPRSTSRWSSTPAKSSSSTNRASSSRKKTGS